MKSIQYSAIITGILAVICQGELLASVTIAGNFATGSPTPTFVLTSDVAIPIINSGSVEFFAFDEWVISDGSITGALASPAVQNISYQINSGPLSTVNLNLLVDNLTFSSGVLTPNDGYLKMNPISVTAGDVLTIKAMTLTFAATSNFNAGLPSTFNGIAFATTNQGGLLGETIIVPEPASMLLLTVALPTFLSRRKRA